MGLFLTGLTAGLTDLEFALIIAIGVVSVVLIIAFMFAFIARIKVWVTYSKYNKIKNSEDLTGKEAAEKFRDLVGIENVQVKKATWWRALFSLGGALGFGNNYSIYRKTIYLRRNIIEKNSLTAVGLGTQKVGLAIQDRDGDKLYRFTARVKPFVFFSPVLFLPIILAGIAIDLVTLSNVGIGTLISVIAAFAINVLSFLLILFTIKAEKKANKKALQLMAETNFLTENERAQINELYKAYILSYTAEFIIALLKLVLDILKVVLKTLNRAKKK